ncbi:MAG: HEAT repeat domain-containing protein [Cyanobacteria bacterium J06623_7]
MDIEQIKSALNNENPQERMKGIRELRNCEADVAAPLLLNHVDDSEFLVRSFVAMGLGRKQSDEAFQALLTMSREDKDPNVRAEAANSLSFYGDIVIAHLRKMYEEDNHWLVRRSIIAVIVDLKCPQELLEICQIGLQGEDEPVMESCLSALGLLAGSSQETAALNLLLSFIEDLSWRIRLQVARSLGRYENSQAIAALSQLKTDPDHRVVGAVLESTIQ